MLSYSKGSCQKAVSQKGRKYKPRLRIAQDVQYRLQTSYQRGSVTVIVGYGVFILASSPQHALTPSYDMAFWSESLLRVARKRETSSSYSFSESPTTFTYGHCSSSHLPHLFRTSSYHQGLLGVQSIAYPRGASYLPRIPETNFSLGRTNTPMHLRSYVWFIAQLPVMPTCHRLPGELPVNLPKHSVIHRSC